MTVALILLLIGTSVIPITAQDIGISVLQPSNVSGQKTDMSCSKHLHDGFGLGSVIRLCWNSNETQEPLQPGGAPRSINLTVTYDTLLSYPFVGKIILLYCIYTHQYVTVTLEVGDIPSWCTTSLSNSQMRFPITGDESSQLTTLTVAVDEHAPAYKICTVPIHASVDTLQGPFGFLPFVNGYDQAASMNFIPGYLPCIIVTPASDVMNATAGNTSHLPITITNAGNARTLVRIEIVDRPSGDWLISIPSQVVLEINMNCESILSVVPPGDFNGTDTITMSFTPYKADDYTQHGDPVYITIVIICEP